MVLYLIEIPTVSQYHAIRKSIHRDYKSLWSFNVVILIKNESNELTTALAS